MSALLRTKPATAVEMTADPVFEKRIKRLVAVSALALGAIFVLQITTADAGWVATGLMLGGWTLMPILLASSLAKPRWRYLLALPGTMVALSLVITAWGFNGSATARAGWWLLFAGVQFGGMLGGWFWYRWMPVPPRFDDPFSTGRWALVAVHAGLVVLGYALVAGS